MRTPTSWSSSSPPWAWPPHRGVVCRERTWQQPVDPVGLVASCQMPAWVALGLRRCSHCVMRVGLCRSLGHGGSWHSPRRHQNRTTCTTNARRGLVEACRTHHRTGALKCDCATASAHAQRGILVAWIPTLAAAPSWRERREATILYIYENIYTMVIIYDGIPYCRAIWILVAVLCYLFHHTI